MKSAFDVPALASHQPEPSRAGSLVLLEEPTERLATTWQRLTMLPAPQSSATSGTAISTSLVNRGSARKRHRQGPR